MSKGLRRALSWIETDAHLRSSLARDPKKTVLYVLPGRLDGEGLGLTAEDQLELVAVAERFTGDELEHVARAMLNGLPPPRQ